MGSTVQDLEGVSLLNRALSCTVDGRLRVAIARNDWLRTRLEDWRDENRYRNGMGWMDIWVVSCWESFSRAQTLYWKGVKSESEE